MPAAHAPGAPAERRGAVAAGVPAFGGMGEAEREPGVLGACRGVVAPLLLVEGGGRRWMARAWSHGFRMQPEQALPEPKPEFR